MRQRTYDLINIAALAICVPLVVLGIGGVAIQIAMAAGWVR